MSDSESVQSNTMSFSGFLLRAKRLELWFNFSDKELSLDIWSNSSSEDEEEVNSLTAASLLFL